MNILVIGCGKVGAGLAQTLDKQGHDVAVVDSSSDSFRLLGDEFNGMTVCGMALDMRVLKSAGVESCDAVAVVTSDDNLNITVSQIVGEFFQVANVLARISDPAREQVFKRFGLKTVCPTNLAAETMSIALTQPWDGKNLVFGSSTVSFVCIDVQEDWVGQDASHLYMDNGRIILGVIREDGSMELLGHHHKIHLERTDRLVLANVSD